MQNFSKSDNFTEKYIPRQQMIRPSIKQKLETQKLTQKRLDKKIGQLSYIHQKTSAGQINTKASNKYLTYEQGNIKKLVRVQEMQQDPFMPPQYKAKRVPQGPRSPPEPLMRSPPKKLTQEDIQEWKIPPCISAWKNTKGYLIPLDVRIEAQKYGKRVPKINNKFQEFSQALYDQEQKTKKYLEEKKKLQAAKQLQELEEQERKLREEVLKTKKEKTKIFQLSSDEENFDSSDDDQKEFKKRELVRKMMKKKVEREYKFKERNNLNRERDLHEQIALGQKVGDFKVQELQVNPKIEEMNAGLNSGYYDDTEIYDKPLFKEQVKTNIYSGVQQDNDYGDNIEEFQQLKKKNQLTTNNRDQPIQFERSKPKIKKEQLMDQKIFIKIYNFKNVWQIL